jgi:peptidoglycan/LPS O-acetylase OafA/YrhL
VKDSPNLDLLRAMAVLLVVGSHLAVAIGYDVEAIGRIGVALFFTHTALVLMLSLERAPAAVPFFIRRFFRIYPLAVFVVLILALGHWLGGVAVNPGELLANILLVQNVTGHDSILGPLWSLPYEVQMYLLLPAVFLLTRVGGARWVAVLLASAVAVIVALSAAGLPYRLLQYLPCFLPGVLAYALRGRRTLNPAILFAALTVCVAIVSALMLKVGVPELPLFWGLCIVLGLLIPRCREIRSPLLARGAKLVATYSYSIYLTHELAIRAAFDLGAGLPLIVQWLVCFAVLIAWARVGYRWIEAPGIALGVRLAETAAPDSLHRDEPLRPAA